MFDTCFFQNSYVEYIFKLYVEWMQRNLVSSAITIEYMIGSVEYELAK